MVNRVCGRVNRTSTVVSMWLQRQSFAIVIAPSLIHVGLAYIHTRASCRTDSLCPDLKKHIFSAPLEEIAERHGQQAADLANRGTAQPVHGRFFEVESARSETLKEKQGHGAHQ
jgi:hypothetical protein